MSDERPTAKCPACGSGSLVDGTMSMDTRWFREGGVVRTGWKLLAFVCRDCGVVTPHLSAANLAALRAKTA
jgi:hypothetical protein